MNALRSMCVVLSILISGCHTSEAPSDWHQEAGYRWRDLSVRGGEPGFTRIEAGTSGITFQNTVSDSLLLGNRILGQGAGVALGDVDGDGRPDIFLARTEGCSALYRNLGNWKFEDITKSAGVGACDRNSTASVLADVDGDGDLDLVLLSTRGPNAIFINDGHAHFTEHRDLGLDPAGAGGATLTLADVDGDGKLDMYVANYRSYNLDDSIPPQRRAVNQTVRQLAKDKFEIVPEFKNEYRLVNRPDMGGLRMSMRGAPDDFYRNDGGRFTKLVFADRFRDAEGKPAADPESFTLTARFADLNGDGVPDLYVTNDFEDTDQLWYNDGHGIFHLADWKAQRQTSNSSMGMDVADINGDGLPDFFVDDMLGGDTRHQKMEIPTHTALPKKFGDVETQLQQQRNVLFLNRGDGTFAEISQFAGVQASGWSWGTLFMDVDLDGRQDILIANGHLWDIMDADTQEGLQNRLASFPWQRLRWQFPTLPLKNVAYRNRGDLSFEDVSAKWHFGTEADFSHTLATADLDGDGDLDVVVNRLRSPALLLRNDASAKRVAVRLRGDAPNTQAVGARIQLEGGAVPVQQKEIAAGGLYMSHSDYEASFAMGSADSATLVIAWRDGRRTTIAGVRPNREYEVTQTTASVRTTDSARVAPVALFEDATELLGGHIHVEPVVDDWDRQFTLPDALTPMGPGIAWFDLDRDGAEDLLVGTGKGGQVGVFHNLAGKLVSTHQRVAPAAVDYTGILAFAENGVSRVLAGASTWHARTLEEMTSQAAVVGMGVQGTSLSGKTEGVIGSHASATGPIALGDIDADGDLDLFVGSRAVPMRYPVAASSALFRNERGTFVLDTVNASLFQEVGLVTSAVFADMNGDGFSDLIVAREWGSLLLFLNDGHGRFHAAPKSFGLDRWTSRWNGVAVGDLDGDGRLDLIATSWGRNMPAQADSSRPLMLYHGPFGAVGEEEMLLARYDASIKSIAPLSSFARIRVAMPDVISRVSNFAAYADASVERVLGPAASTTTRLEAVTLDNMIFLNRGDHFEAIPLPAEAQLAPAFYAGIADFNGDGKEDVFLAQNFSATSIGNPRNDAGRGLILTGDGKGGVRPMSGAESGIVVYGDQRGAGYADYDRDGRLDLAVSQNAGLTRLFHNKAATPGLRVRLQGPASNPDGVGAQMRLVYGDRMGPVREVTSGSGYWSQNGAVQVLGLGGQPTGVWVRWPGGKVGRASVVTGAREVVIRWLP